MAGSWSANRLAVASTPGSGHRDLRRALERHERACPSGRLSARKGLRYIEANYIYTC